MRLGVTGHRPSGLPCKYDENHIFCIQQKDVIRNYFIENEITEVHVGMALGFDTWCAEAALDLGLDVIAHVPFPQQSKTWRRGSVEKYKQLLSRCKRVITYGQYYHNKFFHLRNQGIVDSVDRMISLLKPATMAGGTYNCVEYAKSQEIPVQNLWPNGLDDRVKASSSG